MAGNEVSTLHRALSTILTKLTPEQLQSLMQDVNNSGTVPAHNTTAPNFATPNDTPYGRANLVSSSSTAPVSAAPVVANNMARGNHARSKRARENGKLRPLNSFIAFRSFYSAVFPDLSQKVKSGLLRMLWNSDPFKAKWAILAKAYSTIRDNHSGQVTLESFLALIGPFIGIVAPGDYLRVMGLQLVVDADKQHSVIKVNHNAGPSQQDLTTNLSVDDIVEHCYQTGYVTGVFSNGAGKQGAGLAMAVSAQPNHFHPQEDNANDEQNSPATGSPAQSHASSVHTVDHDNSSPANSDLQSPVSEAAGTPDMSATENQALGPSMQSIANFLPDSTFNGGAANGSSYTAEDFDMELRNAVNAFQFSPEDDGYYALFNPTLQTPVLVYNPYRVQGDYDAFDIGDYVNM